MLAMLPVGVRDDGVLAVDDHGADPVAAHVERRDLRGPQFKVHFPAVRLGELRLVRRVEYVLEAGIVVRQRPAVSRALDVVLAAHRIDPGSLAADVSGHEGEIAEALHVVHAADVLRDPERVVDGSAFGLRVPARRLRDQLRVHPGDGLGPFRRVFQDVLHEVPALRRAVGHEVVVQQSLACDHVGHAEEERDVGPHPERQVDVGHLGQRDPPRIRDDELGAPRHRALDAGGRDGMALGHVGPDAEDHIGLVHVREWVRHRPPSD